MRQWLPAQSQQPGALAVLPDLITALAQPDYAASLLARVRDLLPATSLSVYRTGPDIRPARYLSASHIRPDTTHACWQGYMSGPWKRDVTLLPSGAAAGLHVPVVCHITAPEVPGEHRAKVYEALGRVERVSVVSRDADRSVFAINFYRHLGEQPFRDAALADFSEIAPALLALTRKHLALLGVAVQGHPAPNHGQALTTRHQLAQLQRDLTPRELDVCERLLLGMTMEGIAGDLGLSLATVKTYRNRAFTRMGLHFRSELFALMRTAGEHG